MILDLKQPLNFRIYFSIQTFNVTIFLFIFVDACFDVFDGGRYNPACVSYPIMPIISSKYENSPFLCYHHEPDFTSLYLENIVITC